MISCQFSLYPLGTEDIGPVIGAACEEIKLAGLAPETSAMSTYVTGESSEVFEALRRAFDKVASNGHVVMTITVSNACPLPL